MTDKKKIATQILGTMSEGGEVKSQEMKAEEPIDEKMMGLHAAAQDFMQAIKDGSAHGATSALQAFIDMHQPADYDDRD